MIIADKIIEKANRIYQQLGICHTEHVFSKALQLELYNLGAVLVERERAAPCFYKCSNGKTHILSIERIDLLVRSMQPGFDSGKNRKDAIARFLHQK